MRLQPGLFWLFAVEMAAGVSPVHAQTFGPVIPKPTYINLYWDTTWDADVPAFPARVMDSFTWSVVNSSYLGGLAEYGVTGATFGGSFLANANCIPQSPPRVALYDLFSTSVMGFILCEINSGYVPSAPGIIYNVFLAPSSLESDLWGNVLSCGRYSAYHWRTDALPGQSNSIFTVIFSNPLCGSMTANLTHEMVEAATDPFPPLSVLLAGGTGELADPCAVTPNLPFAGGTATNDYISLRAGGCRRGFTVTTAPAISALQTVGFGPSISISITGSGFGTLPSSIVLPADMTLPWISVRDLTQGWEAGNSLDANAASLKLASWSPGNIAIRGIDGGVPAPRMLPLDLLLVTVCNPLSELCTSRTVTLPQAPAITTLTPSSGPVAGNTNVKIIGTGFGSQSQTQVRFGGALASIQTITPTEMQVSSPPSSTFGFVPVQVFVNGAPGSTATYSYCRPAISRVEPNSGPVGGGTSIRISGRCFTGATSVRFGPFGQVAAGPQMIVASDNLIVVTTIPGPPDCGYVDVQVAAPFGNGSTTSVTTLKDVFTYGDPSCGPGSDHEVFCMTHPRKCPQQLRASNVPGVRISEAASLADNVQESTGRDRQANAIGESLAARVQPAGRNNVQSTAPVTRAEFAIALDRGLQLEDTGRTAAFADVDARAPSAKSYQRIAPYLKVYREATGAMLFYEGAPVEREEASVALVDALVAAHRLSVLQNPSEVRSALSAVSDASWIAKENQGKMATALRSGLVTVDTHGAVRPRQLLDRAELLEMLDRAQKQIRP